MSGFHILNKKGVVLCIIVSSLLFATACSEIRDIKNQRVNELVEKISQMEYVNNVIAYNMAFFMTIDMNFERGFTAEDSLEILELAKYYLDADTVEALRIEFGQVEYPKAEIFIRSDKGTIRYSFVGAYNYSNYTGYEWLISSMLKDISNPRVNELVEKISQMEYVVDIEAYHSELYMVIKVNIEQGFTEEDSLEILKLTKYYIDADTLETLRIEFGMDGPPDTTIFIQENYSLLNALEGSCYESTNRDEPPDCVEYRWNMR